MKLKELKEWLDKNYTEENKNKPVYLEQWSEEDSPLTEVTEEKNCVVLGINL